MPLTTEDVAVLSQPFDIHEHAVHEHHGFFYIKPEAIIARIASVDPGFGYDIEMIGATPAEAKGKNSVTATKVYQFRATISVKGTIRSAVGAGYTVSLGGDSAAWDENSIKMGETDALKRVARVFQIGLYLWSMPKTVKTYPTLLQYLAVRFPTDPRFQPAIIQARWQAICNLFIQQQYFPSADHVNQALATLGMADHVNSFGLQDRALQALKFQLDVHRNQGNPYALPQTL